MSNVSLVSVVVPIYNGEKYIDECLNSIMKQTYSNIEIILVNDASNDKTQIKLIDFLSKDKRIKLINLEVNAGVSNARHVGVKYSKGEWVCFIDIDDYVKPYYIESFIKNIKSGIEVYCIEGVDELVEVNRWVSGLLKKEYSWFVHHKMYSRRVLLDNKVLEIPKFINIGEDLILNLRVSKFVGDKVRFINSDSYVYRYNLESVSRNRKFSLIYEESFITEVEKNLGDNASLFCKELWLFKFRIWKKLIENNVYVSHDKSWIKSLLINRPKIDLGIGDRFLLWVKNYYISYIGLKVLSLFKYLRQHYK